MKRTLAFFLIVLIGISVQAQVKSVEKETKRQGTRRVNRKIDKGVSSGLDKLEDGIGSLFGKKKKKGKTEGQSDFNNSGTSVAGKDPDALFAEHGIYPPDNATEVSIPVTLKWPVMNNGDFRAARYELYLDIVNADGSGNNMLGISRKNEYECKGLKQNTKYTWKYVGQASNDQYMPGGGGTFTTGSGSAGITSTGSNSQTNTEDFGAFSSMFPANGGVIADPPFLDWEIPNESDYKFTVHLEGDDWPDWLSKTTTKTNISFEQLPTATTSFKWQVIAEGNGKRLESPWQSFTTTDGTNLSSAGPSQATAPKMEVQWSKFDFVPGDEVIFEDAPGTDEENGEFPSHWDLYEGSAEIGAMNGEPIIMFLNGGGAIIPYLKNSDEDYLPEIFTIEFDVWFPKGRTTNNRYFISFRDLKNQWNKGLKEHLSITPTGLEFGNTDKRYPGTENLGWSEEPTGKWRHISIAYTKGKFKAYMDDTRLINVPHLEGNPWGLTIKAQAENMYLKNIRIAKGGVKYYDRVLSDGKIIVNGIRFDVNKATIKPESNGAINKIYKLMQKQPELNFSVEGHTDSDGDNAPNQKLSEERAKAVMNRLISMGISADRLKSAGWGESKPIGENGTAEGKANNRRVEFITF